MAFRDGKGGPNRDDIKFMIFSPKSVMYRTYAKVTD
jgi:hypothetical protein